MDTTRTCPHCQQPLSADAPDGLCPQCLMRAASGPPPTAAGDDLPGDIIDIGDPSEVAKKLPQFEIVELLGRGGMGVVYKARQLQLDRLVALKILPPVDALSPDFVARFTREARALAKLNHPNIVNVHDFGETAGLYYIVMEYVEGANLRQLLEARKLTPAEALAIVPKICDALQYAHEEGLVHRDIKPENLLIDKKGRVKIADFGLAKLLRREPLDMTLTLSGMALGTLRYMAPEQMDKPETVDHRADLYSLGVVIYEMLTGETPVGRFELPSQKAQVDVRLDKIVLHALEREPARRYQQASEVRDDVERVTGRPQSAGTASLQDTGAPDGPRLSRRALWGAICVALGLVADLVIFVLVSNVAYHLGLIHDGDRGIPSRFLPIILACLPFGVALPVVGTMLGWRALREIRGQPGRFAGRGLALAAALTFPLLLLDVLVAGAFDGLVSFLGGLMRWDYRTKEGLWILLSVPACLALDIWLFAKVWRDQAGHTAGEQREPVPPPAPEAPAAPRQPRHLLAAVLVLLCLLGFFFGLSFQATHVVSAEGQTRLITVGALDPLFVSESGPSGFRTGFNFVSWSFVALAVAGIAFGALWRIGREDQGKVPRDPAWWRGWWKQVGVWGGVLLIACIFRTVMSPSLPQRPGEKTASASAAAQRKAAAVPLLGAITSGIGAEFTVPAGQVAMFEIVTRRAGATVPIPPLAAYVLAPADRTISGTFHWRHETEPETASPGGRRWRLEVVSEAGNGSTGGHALPRELEEAVGAMGLTLGPLEPNEEAVHWVNADAENAPADGLVGLRISVVGHNLKSSGSGVAHIDWKKGAKR